MARILLVDDVANVRESLGYFLKMSGYKVLEAADGFEAFNICRAQRPDLIITDIRMPGMSGLQLIAKIRKEINPDQSFIAMSGDISDEEVGWLSKQNIRFFRKPPKLQALRVTVSLALA